MGDNGTSSPARRTTCASSSSSRSAHRSTAPGTHATRAAQHGADPRHQLLEAERLHEVVVAAEREPAHLVVGAVARGEEQHRRPYAVVAKPAAHLEAVEVGQHDVEHDQVGIMLLDGVERVTTRAGGAHLETLVAEGRFEHGPQVVLVVDEQEPFACHVQQRRRWT